MIDEIMHSYDSHVFLVKYLSCVFYDLLFLSLVEVDRDSNNLLITFLVMIPHKYDDPDVFKTYTVQYNIFTSINSRFKVMICVCFLAVFFAFQRSKYICFLMHFLFDLQSTC